jgi:tRNA (guanine26-N2/guanine27-N2)-dimethyltransferase
MYMQITENNVKFFVIFSNKMTKKAPVFYNPKMKLARDVAVYIVNKLKPKSILDAMAGTGVRSIRFVKEAMVENVVANDVNLNAYKLMKKNFKLNKLKVQTKNLDVNLLLRECEGFDYIDIDPFGSPVYFVESAASSLKNNGVLALTATDLGPLYGKYPKTCMRKYTALPLNNHCRNELALRILIYKAQIIASKFDKALMPIFVHSDNHYVRVYLKAIKSKKQTNEVLSQHKEAYYSPKTLKMSFTPDNSLEKYGPFYVGRLWDERLLKGFDLIKYIKDEAAITTVGYYNIPKIEKKLKLNCKKKIPELVEEIKQLGYAVSRTHFSSQGVRSDIPVEELVKLLK